MGGASPVIPVARSSFLSAVERESGQRIMDCYQCGKGTAGCPCEIDIARVMESLRLMAAREGRARERDIALFHRLFLRSVEASGRLWELGLVGFYNLSS